MSKKKSCKKSCKKSTCKVKSQSVSKKKSKDCPDGVCPINKPVSVQSAPESWGTFLLKFLRLR